MGSRFHLIWVAIGALAMTSAAGAQDQQSTTFFNAPVEIEFDQFADYPCSDAVGHAAKCYQQDDKGVLQPQHDCVDAKRQRVQCVQPIENPPPRFPGDPPEKPRARHVTLLLPTQDTRPRPELVFRDERSRITVRVQTDGRHVSGVDAKGKQLWSRDPFTDSGIDPYRFAVPKINSIGPASSYWRSVCDEEAKAKNSTCIFISYDSTQFGLLNVRTGDFYQTGQQ